jgi:hypothetical protein
MRFIPTIVHGLADYAVGLVVMVLPFYFGWAESRRVAFVALGFLVICYSLTKLLAPTLLSIPSNGSAPVYSIGVLSILLSFTTKIRAQGTRSQAAI